MMSYELSIFIEDLERGIRNLMLHTCKGLD